MTGAWFSGLTGARDIHARDSQTFRTGPWKYLRKLRITDYMTFALHRLRLSIFAEFPFILRIRYIVMISGVYCVYDVIWLILCGKCFHQIRDQTEQLLDKLSRTSSPDESNYDLFHPRGVRKLLKGKRSLKNRR